jgi:1-acyl-sn-glycerol-3-phosphate acyltransferase
LQPLTPLYVVWGCSQAVCKDLLDHNVPITVFPEGARSRTGHMQTFKDGFFQFAAENGACATDGFSISIFSLLSPAYYACSVAVG